MVKQLVTFLALIFAYAATNAATPRVNTMTGIFDEHFHTLITRNDDSPSSLPIIRLGSDDRLTIMFDEISDDRSYLRYSITHCNADWQPSGLVDTEVLEGFNIGDIDDYAFSRATTVHYVNYRITLPNEDFQFKVSGNYLLKVYNEDDPDTILLQTRFMICEPTARVTADILSATDVDYNDSHQQLSVTVDATDAHVDDVFNDLIVIIGQNGRLDNEVSLRQPLRAVGNKAVYEHLPRLIFPAGNEYRRFEIVQTTYPGMGVESIEYLYPYYHATLRPDSPRSSSSYLYDQTQHGRFFVREYNSDESDIDADYMVVHFTLDMPENPNVSIFLDGDFVRRRFDPESLMTFNRATGRYERVLLLKQGAYNYQYLAVPSGAGSGQTSAIEGDFYQTANEYLIKVYHRRRGERYDRFIGFTNAYFR